MSMRKKLASASLACIIATTVFSVSTPARASDAGAFIGGVFATKLLSNASRRADAEEEQADAMQQQASRPASSGSSQSAEQRIQELDKLAAGGYITPEEYKKKKKAIIDSM